MQFLEYLHLVFRTWFGILGTISLLLGFLTRFIQNDKFPAKILSRCIIVAACIGLFYSGFKVWRESEKKLAEFSKPHFDYYWGPVFYGTNSLHKGQLYILCNGLITNRSGANASILGWRLRLVLKNGKEIFGTNIPNVTNDRQVTIHNNGDTIVASPDLYLPELTLPGIKAGDSRAGWLWVSFPITESEFKSNLPADLYIEYLNSYDEIPLETKNVISNENLGNALFSDKEKENNNTIRTDKVKQK
jgi:hypothetical protein